MKLWGGRFTDRTNELVETYTASIMFDKRLVSYDIQGSIAHARMLGNTGIIPAADARTLITGLEEIAVDVLRGAVEFSVADEDIHMNVERLLHERIGAVAGKLHTGRSRNDQVALDMHMFVREMTAEVVQKLTDVQAALIEVAEANDTVIIPGYTHLQRAQPILLAHHMLAYVWMLERDKARFQAVSKSADVMPLGAGALAGTTFPIDRQAVQQELDFSALYENSLDAVSNRDYLLEFLAATSLTMMHLSRLSEEFILWSSEEFGFIELADAYCTGSSMMPQKKNPDVAELVRGKTGRVYGHLLGLLTVMKGLPLAYNKDLQEDKEGVFDACDTLLPALQLFAGMVRTMKLRTDRIALAFAHDFSNATDLADYLVQRGMPFREAHAVVGRLVLKATTMRTNLQGIPIAVFRDECELFAEDVYDTLDLNHVVGARKVRGGTAPSAVKLQLQLAKACL
jgi:argininosuccinate lyase